MASIYDYSVMRPDGSALELKDCEGKVILIVNTATRCGFTPQYNELEEIYEKYHERGLDYVLVSIDADRNAWLKAIEKDKSEDLGIHLIDNKSITRKLYGYPSIPITLLIHPDGIIVGNDMRGKRLDDKLSEIFDI